MNLIEELTRLAKETNDPVASEYLYEKYKYIPENYIKKHPDEKDIEKKAYSFYDFCFKRYFDEKKNCSLYNYIYMYFYNSIRNYSLDTPFKTRNKVKKLIKEIKNNEKSRNEIFFEYKYLIDNRFPNKNMEEERQDGYYNLLIIINNYFDRNINMPISTYLDNKVSLYYKNKETNKKEIPTINTYQIVENINDIDDIDTLIDIKEKLKVPYFKDKHIKIFLESANGTDSDTLALKYNLSITRINMIIQDMKNELINIHNGNDKKLILDINDITKDMINEANLNNYELSILGLLLSGKTRLEVSDIIGHKIKKETYQNITKKLYKIK